MVRTGAFGYIKWGYEATYGSLAATRDNVFGLEQKASSVTYTNNKIVLSELNTVFPLRYAFGQARADVSIAFVLSNPWWLKMIFDTRTPSTGGGTIAAPIIYSISTKLMPSFSLEIAHDQATIDSVRVGKGSVLKSITLSAPVGDVVRCTADIAYGTEDSTQAIDTTPPTDNISFPYTFAYGKLQVTTPTGTERVLAEVQSIDLTLNTNAELLYSVGTGGANPTGNQPVGAYRKLFELTGRFSLSMADRADSPDVTPAGTTMDMLNWIYAQIGANSQALSAEGATLTLTFDNGLATTAKRAITFKLTGVVLDEHSVSIEPNEPIFEDIPFQARGITVEAITDTVTEPA